MADAPTMFASLEGLPTTMGAGHSPKNLKPIDSDREFKSRYDEDTMVVGTEGFTIFASLNYHPDLEDAGSNFVEGEQIVGQVTPKTYFRFTIGKTPSYSFYFGS